MKTDRSPLIAIFCVMGMLAGSVQAIAQEITEPKAPAQAKPGSPDEKATITKLPPPGDGTFKFIGGKFALGKVVTGAPYSANAVTESTQTLSDGNQIVRKNEAKVYRDSEGRTRIDQRLETIGKWSANGEAPMITIINDPVAGVSYSIDQRTRTVHKNMSKSTKLPPGVGGKLPTVKGQVVSPADHEAMVQKKMKAAEAAPAGEKTYVVNGRTVSQAEAEALATEKKRKVGEEMSKDGSQFELKRRPTPVFPAKIGPGPGERKTESLGTQVIEGVTAEGTRTTLTIPAGEIGNVLPLEIVDESWYSSELQLQVMTKHQDPRSGVVLYRLTNLNRGEPERSLFEIPDGYTVIDGSSPQPKPARRPQD